MTHLQMLLILFSTISGTLCGVALAFREWWHATMFALGSLLCVLIILAMEG